MSEVMFKTQIVGFHKKTKNQFRGSVITHQDIDALENLAHRRVNELNKTYNGQGWEYKYTPIIQSCHSE